MQVAGEGGEGAKAALQLFHHQEHHAHAERQDEEAVDVIAPGRQQAAGAEQGIIEVMQAPEEQSAGDEPRAGRAGALPEAEEDQSGPEGGGAQQHHGEDCGEEKVVQQVDGDVGPGHRQDRGHPIDRAPELAALEGERGGEDGKGGPDGDHLVEVEPGSGFGDQKSDDEGDADGVEHPGAAPPEEVGATVAVVEQGKEEGQPDGDGGLENRRFALDQDRGGVHPVMLTLGAASRHPREHHRRRKVLFTARPTLVPGAELPPFGFESPLLNEAFQQRQVDEIGTDP